MVCVGQRWNVILQNDKPQKTLERKGLDYISGSSGDEIFGKCFFY